MAFSIDNLARISSTANGTTPVFWSYISAVDNLATVKASAYFNNAMTDLTNGAGRFKIGDVIYAKASDGYAFMIITAVTTNVTVALFVAAT